MKKVLSWALVLALVLSSFTMAFAGDTANSSQMKDADQIKYVEAVDVMIATGIIKGYPDGTFLPAKNVTRAEMAKMITVLKNGGEDVGDLYAGSCTFADSASHWAAGYIAYCANEGIIAGRDANTFDPDANVTGTEAAKMLLVAAGYDAAIEGYTGSTWAASVLRDAKKNDLFEDLDNFDPSKQLTREEAAQIIFNAMNMTTVEYDYGTQVVVGDTTVSVTSTKNDVTKPAKYDTNDNGTIELFEEAFEGDLAKKESASGDFGEPAHSWSYDGDDVGTYTDEADITFIVNDDENLYTAIEDYDEDFYDDYCDGEWYIDEVLVNGEYVETPDCVELGDTVEMYEVSDDQYVIIIKHYDAYQIAEVDTDVKDKDAKDGVTAYVDIDGLGTYNDDDIVGYDAKTYVEDAVIQVAINDDDEILDSYIAEKVTGELEKKTSSTYTVAGTKYDVASCFNAVDGKYPAVENEYDFFLYNGYINGSLFVEDNSTTYYGVYLKTGKEKSAFDDGNTVVKMATAKGEEEVFTVDEDYIVPEISEYTLIAYTLNDDGEIDSIKAADKDFTDKTMKTGGTIAGKTVAEDVVAFAYDSEEEEWIIYDYDDLEAADEFSAAYIMDDDEMAALFIDGDLEASDDILGFITDYEVVTTKDGNEVEITALIDGEEVTLTTVAKKGDGNLGLISDISNLCTTADMAKFTFDKDDNVTAVAPAVVQSVSELSDDFEDADIAMMGNKTKLLTVADKSGTSINVGTADNKDYQSIAGAAVYYINEVGELEIASASKIKKNTGVVLIQTKEDAAAWNIVLVSDDESAQFIEDEYTFGYIRGYEINEDDGYYYADVDVLTASGEEITCVTYEFNSSEAEIFGALKDCCCMYGYGFINEDSLSKIELYNDGEKYFITGAEKVVVKETADPSVSFGDADVLEWNNDWRTIQTIDAANGKIKISDSTIDVAGATVLFFDWEAYPDTLEKISLDSVPTDLLGIAEMFKVDPESDTWDLVILSWDD